MEIRAISCIVVDYTVGGMSAEATVELWQDKRPHIAAWTVGCFDWLFSGFPHIADYACDVRTLNLSNVFNETCTSQRVTP
ncbi:hypothetical protein [Brucella pseudintermedia]|uniref:hypothetical protein n=1 Tax=Brucella pseudintermedia TaxID=370111 RepID=UPI00124CEBDB|nr:hypothetical protein [Brucella pseudintermedia]